MIGTFQCQSGVNFGFRASRRSAKWLSSLDGDVAEWLKAAVC